jgi:cyclohexanone monooxygenase
MWNFTNLTSGIPEPEDMVGDGWTDIIGKMIETMKRQRKEGLSPAQLGEIMEMADFEKMEQIRARVDEMISNGDIAESLKPYYRQFCKRPCFHDEYLKTFNRPNVTLVDTDGKGPERITEKGIVANGVEYEVDCIIYASGFEVGTSFTRRAGAELYGRNGITLTEYWEKGARTMHGFHVRNFPNMFIISPVQSAMTVNFTHMLDAQSTHLAHIIDHCLSNDIEVVEVTEEGEQQWVDAIVGMSQMNAGFQTECTPGYYNNEGQAAAEGARQSAGYGAGPVALMKLFEAWRDAGKFEGLELTPPRP